VRPALLVTGLSKTYAGGGADGTRALRELSLAVRPGEILGLVGPNGAGKTTALRTIAGILPIQHGSIEICGHDLVRAERAAKLSLAWVPDDPQPFETLTVIEHLEFTAALYGMRDWRARADELLLRAELTAKRDALGGELSRGMRQKLALCCAWLPRPALVLLDEPLTGLDPRGIQRAKDAIRAQAAEGTAVILSSHLLDLVEELAQRLLILDRGETVFLGTLDEARAKLAPGVAGELGAPGKPGTLRDIFFAATAGSESAEGSE
jgi:ABC-2 type transport system ATP-binding protein